MASSLYLNLRLTTPVGKVALVTCVNTGFGLATTKRFAREGAAFLVTYPA